MPEPRLPPQAKILSQARQRRHEESHTAFRLGFDFLRVHTTFRRSWTLACLVERVMWGQTCASPSGTTLRTPRVPTRGLTLDHLDKIHR